MTYEITEVLHVHEKEPEQLQLKAAFPCYVPVSGALFWWMKKKLNILQSIFNAQDSRHPWQHLIESAGKLQEKSIRLTRSAFIEKLDLS